MSKIVPKSIQTWFERVLGRFWQCSMEASKNFCPVKNVQNVPWRVESSKYWEQSKKSQKFQKCPKSFPKVSKRVLNVFCDEFFRKKKFYPAVPWKARDSSQNRSQKKSILKKVFKKNRKNPKKFPKLFPKVSKRVLNVFCDNFFEKKNFWPVFHGGSRLLNLEKNRKNLSKIVPKVFRNFKNALNCSQKYPNVFWTSFVFSKKKFWPVFHGGSKILKKTEKISIFRICPKSFPKVLNVFWGDFFKKKFFDQCSMEARDF